MESIGPYRDTDWDLSDVLSVFRAEKESSAYDTIDYTVLSVVVATLGLILFVELIRHKFDELARGRPFFNELIACVNSELATLGIVEFVLFIIQKYYTGLNKAQKQVFADVHFMLFYCALFNALESAILAMKVFWVAERTWVRTELLELAHYIEIREEFERVDAILYGETRKDTEFVLEYNTTGLVVGLRELWQRFYRFVRYPILSRRRKELLVQVRFHDLRVHFLKANNLPLQLHVSDYLKRSLLKKLKRLVHISAVAWLLLTGVVNLIYFLMGIVVYVTGDVSKVANSLAWIFVSSMVFFVLLSLMIFNKMNWIFQRIMRMKLINESANSDFKSGVTIRKGEKEVQNQSDLFWGGNPNYIIVAIQFSQFGFALALSILLVFWDDINVKGNPVPSYAYLVTVFACYGTFVLIIAQVFPRYTLCTSLGQLVDKKHLQETLAQFHLKESQRKQQQLLDEQDDEFFETEAFNDVSAFGPLNSGIVTLSNRSKKAENPTECQSYLLANLVKTDTHALCSSLPVERNVQTQPVERKMRRYAASDGVAFTCQMSGPPPVSVPKANIPSAPVARQKGNSSSAAIQQMEDAEHASLLADLVQTDTLSLRSAMPIEHSAQNQHAERKMRRKTSSEGVASLRQTSGTKLPPLVVPKPNIRPARLVRQKSNSWSGAIQQMKDAEHDLDQPTRKSSSGSPSTRSPLTQLSESPMPDNEQQMNQGVRESSLLSESRGPSEDQPMVDHAPTLPHLVKKPSSTTSSLPHFPKESTVEVTESPIALPQIENAPDSDDICGIVDIAKIDTDNTKEHASEPEKCQSLYDAVYDYFLGPNYPVVSAVLGTLGVLFVIGQRIEGLLLATGALANLENTWQFQPVVSFWWETTYLCCFIVASFFISIICRPDRASTNRKRSLFLAGVLDIMLSSACLVLLMFAEAQRCYCAEEGSNMADCCAPFGSRSYGGIGKIEPITSIIVLRLFRFSLAQRVIKFLNKWIEWPNTGIAHGGHDSPNEKHHHGHHGGHSADPHDALVGMWQAAISMYPDVVEEHGEFSSELLQAMLGIRTVEDPAKHRVSATRQDESVTLDINVSREEGSAQAPQNAGHTYVPTRVLNCQKSEEKHETLSSEAQSCIVGGKDRPKSSPAIAPMAPSEDHLNEEQFFFINPSAKLLRSMQRCDRKLLPLIDRWTVVDLVITKYEIVYFDASDVDDPSSIKYSPDALRAMELTRQALRATKGGKGLRLRDVATGRKVVGHLAISAVDSVHVERLLPHEEDAERLNAEGKIERQDKFWEVNEKTMEHFANDDPPCRGVRWAKLKEDHLLIHSVYGTLCFRFYCDLENAEVHRDRCLSEREETGSLFKNNALLWCQTVVRLCKRAQLKQNLDHYGDGDDEELRDYLRVIDPKKEAHYRVLGKLRGRASSFRSGGSRRNIYQPDDLEAASVHTADTLLRVEDSV